MTLIIVNPAMIENNNVGKSLDSEKVMSLTITYTIKQIKNAIDVKKGLILDDASIY
jgi:hypothetical protein